MRSSRCPLRGGRLGIALAAPLLLTLEAGAMDVPATQPLPPTAIDPARPDTWREAATGLRVRARTIAGELIAVAEDERRPAAERRAAILALGELDGEEGLRFLVENVALRLDLTRIKGDEDLLLQTPCKYALYRRPRRWDVVPVILDALDAPKTPDERLHLGDVLGRVLTTGRARALLDHELARSHPPVRAENLAAIRGTLQD